MKTSNIFATVALVLQGQNVQATLISSLTARWKSSSLLSILELIKDFIPVDGPVKAWDYGAYPNMCKIEMQTKDGGNCWAKVECADGSTEYKEDDKGWNQCRVGGENKFIDSRIGEWSVTFKERDGKGQGEGLTTPILKMKYVGNWKEIEVEELAQHYEDSDEGAEGPFLCRHGNYPTMGTVTDIASNRRKKWFCGVPKIGKGGAGLDSNGPVNDRGYRPGTCNIHVKQFQKPDPSKDKYQIEISAVTDENETKIGGVGKSGPDVTLKSKLPKSIRVWTLAVDKDPVKFHYGEQKWTSDDGNCETGKYDGGDREMDCNFKC